MLKRLKKAAVREALEETAETLADTDLDRVSGGVRRQSGRLYYRDGDPGMTSHNTSSVGVGAFSSAVKRD